MFPLKLQSVPPGVEVCPPGAAGCVSWKYVLLKCMLTRAALLQDDPLELEGLSLGVGGCAPLS